MRRKFIFTLTMSTIKFAFPYLSHLLRHSYLQNVAIGAFLKTLVQEIVFKLKPARTAFLNTSSLLHLVSMGIWYSFEGDFSGMSGPLIHGTACKKKNHNSKILLYL